MTSAELLHDDRSQIVETTVRMATLTDQRAWADLVDVFAPTVTVDYTSLNGGEPAEIASSDLIAGWSAALGRLAVTQHLMTNHLVTIDHDQSTVSASFQATHIPPPPDERRWVLGGDYRFTLTKSQDGWRIRSVTMTARWETGDRAILA